MHNEHATDTPRAWTWAEQISTYRFWGLVLCYLLSLIGSTLLSTFLPIFLRDQIDLTIGTETGLLAVLMGVGGLFGLYLAWTATRWQPVPLLIVAAGLQLLGGLLLTRPSLASAPLLRWAGAWLLGLGSGTITLTVPAVIVGGRGGAETFVLAFGVTVVLSRVGQMAAPYLMAELWDRFGASALGTTVALCLALALLSLLPVQRPLFSVPPPPRGAGLPPTRRSPGAVILACLIPFYWLYWLYRAHGEIASLAPTSARAILAPRAAVLSSLFVPLFTPLITTKLNDALNQHAVQTGQPPYRTSRAVFLSSLLFYPLAMAWVQSAMNQTVSARTNSLTSHVG